MSSDKNRQSFKAWYTANKESFNAKRKEKYHSDPEARQKAIERQAEYRAKNPRKSTAGAAHFRKSGGEEKQVFRVGDVSEFIGRDEQVIRLWERKGWIPKPTVEGKHRYYTIGQIGLLKEMAELMDQVRYDKSIRDIAMKKKSDEIHVLWESS